MADMPEFHGLNFPGIPSTSFHPRCDINYHDGNRNTEVNCWLGSLPDLDQTKPVVLAAHKKHIKKLLSLGIDGFRFDAAKHMPASIVQKYIDYANAESGGKTWNYLEVIEDDDTNAEDYTPVAAVTDFVLYRSMKAAFSFAGDLRRLRVPGAVDDPRSVTFGRNHDNIKEINPQAIDPYDDRTDSFLATAFVLARQAGTPIVLNWDNFDNPFIRYGVEFRRIMRQREAAGALVKDNVLAVVDSPTLLIMERGSEGFFVVNKAAQKFDIPVLDLTLTNLQGCYRELRNGFNVARRARIRSLPSLALRPGLANEVQSLALLHFHPAPLPRPPARHNFFPSLRSIAMWVPKTRSVVASRRRVEQGKEVEVDAVGGG